MAKSKLYTVTASNGLSCVMDGVSYEDLASKLGVDPLVPPGAVVGIEGPRGGLRFYKKRNTVLFPISASAAAVETHCVNPEPVR